MAEPNPANGIPIFRRSQYRYYLRATRILEGFALDNSFTLGFNRHRYDQASSSWTDEGAFTALMTWTTAPSGFPGGADDLTGEVKDASGTVVGSLTVGWVSRYLRRAVIEIDRANASETAIANGAGLGWKEIFAQIGWDMTVDESDTKPIAARRAPVVRTSRSGTRAATSWQPTVASGSRPPTTPRSPTT